MHWPIIVRGGTLTNGHPVRYVLNYSVTAQATPATMNGTDLLSGQAVKRGGPIDLPAWGVAIIEGDSATP